MGAEPIGTSIKPDPPYVRFSVLLDVLQYFAANPPLPDPLDLGAHPFPSGAQQRSELRGALRWLGLIDQKDKPTTDFSRFTKAADQRAELKRLLLRSYGDAVDLTDATDGAELLARMLRAGRLGENASKATRFLRYAVAYANGEDAPQRVRSKRPASEPISETEPDPHPSGESAALVHRFKTAVVCTLERFNAGEIGVAELDAFERVSRLYERAEPK